MFAQRIQGQAAPSTVETFRWDSEIGEFVCSDVFFDLKLHGLYCFCFYSFVYFSVFCLFVVIACLKIYMTYMNRIYIYIFLFCYSYFGTQ